MCGIAGYINLDGRPVDLGIAARMANVQRHRGPDDQRFRLFSLANGASKEVCPDAVGSEATFESVLGFNRLSILDLSQHGHQPMVSADGSVILAFNGEIYNAFDYRAELEAAGFRFRSKTDTEVVLYLYQAYGLAGMLERLNGMFAIALVDLRTAEIHLCRDHLGVKPLYWTAIGSTILFASEVKSFLCHPQFKREVDEEYLDEYLTFRFLAGEASLLKGVRRLRPGHRLRITRDGVSTHRYWQIPDDCERAPICEAEAIDRFGALLHDSVRSQLLSDVKVGCQLSGGIDSSVVAVSARSHFDADMEAFSVVFDDPGYSEEPWIDEAARIARATTHRYRFTSDFFFDTLEKATWHRDEPLAHPNSLGIWLLSQGARGHVTVLLSGEGADEVLGGYTRFYYARLRPRVSPWLPLLERVPRLGARLERQFGGNPVDRFIGASLFNRPDELLEARPAADFERVLLRRRAIFEEGTSDHLSNCMKYEMQTYMENLLIRQDAMTMAHSQENRVPFVDRNIVSFARSLPQQFLVSDAVVSRNGRMGATKVILKKFARRTFSDRFVYRWKSGFSLPLPAYFADPRFEALMEERFLPGMRNRGLVDADAVTRLWRGRAQSQRGPAETLWIYVALEQWAQLFVDQRVH